ncbi:MAG TPA: hypothetical protein ENN54_02690 [Thermoplasmatales archaeon]|nr:hypothetical protein [Thermoplasmatales archaeon]
MRKTAVVVAVLLATVGSLGQVSATNGEILPGYGAEPGPPLQNLVDTELIVVPNLPFLGAPSVDCMVGKGMVHGFFLAANGLAATRVSLCFHKWVPPGWVSFDPVCTHLSLRVVDWKGVLVDQHEFTGPGGFLFSNNWRGAAVLARPSLSAGLFFFVFIEIYGNYE